MVVGAAILIGWGGRAVEAQNDWQYPDPYFGILEIEKSHEATTWRRYRNEVSPPPRRDAAADRQAAGIATAEQAAPVRPQRQRWRNRSRR